MLLFKCFFNKSISKFDVFTPILQSRYVFLGGGDGTLLLLPPNTGSGVYTIKFNSGHLWSQVLPSSFGSSRWSLVNFRQALTWSILSRGTFKTRFQPMTMLCVINHSLFTVVSAVFWSLTYSCSVVLGEFLTVLKIICNRGVIACIQPQSGGDC